MKLVSSFTVTFFILVCGLSQPAMAQDDVAAGRAEFQQSCQNCHGESGKGDGRLAEYLTIKPADLTLLSKSNNGQFPFLKVFQTIDGRAVVKTHGDGPMQIWGDRYKYFSGASEADPSKTFTRSRILELTYYIQSLQM